MNTRAALRPAPPEPPEWRRSGRFLLLAATLHAAVLAWPLARVVSDRIAKPLPAINVELVRPNDAAPAVSRAPLLPAPPARQAAPAKASSAPQRPPVIALAASTEHTAPAFTVPAAQPAPAVRAAPAESTAPAPAPAAPFTAARFNAAYLNNPEPKYPLLSRRLGEEGKVLLKVRVTPDGLPAAVELEKSSNFERLDAAAREVVARWRFVPARQGEQPIESSVIVPIVFRLDG